MQRTPKRPSETTADWLRTTARWYGYPLWEACKADKRAEKILYLLDSSTPEAAALYGLLDGMTFGLMALGEKEQRELIQSLNQAAYNLGGCVGQGRQLCDAGKCALDRTSHWRVIDQYKRSAEGGGQTVH